MVGPERRRGGGGGEEEGHSWSRNVLRMHGEVAVELSLAGGKGDHHYRRDRGKTKYFTLFFSVFWPWPVPVKPSSLSCSLVSLFIQNVSLSHSFFFINKQPQSFLFNANTIDTTVITLSFFVSLFVSLCLSHTHLHNLQHLSHPVMFCFLSPSLSLFLSFYLHSLAPIV